MSNHFPTKQQAELARRAGRALRDLRRRRGLGRREAAEALGLRNDYLAAVEAGKRDAAWTEVVDLLNLLDADLSEFVAAVAGDPNGEVEAPVRPTSPIEPKAQPAAAPIAGDEQGDPEGREEH